MSSLEVPHSSDMQTSYESRPTHLVFREVVQRSEVAVVYPYIPHYRKPVFLSLLKSRNFAYRFFYSRNMSDKTIKSEEDFPEIERLPIMGWGPFSFQFGLLRKLLFGKDVAFVFLGNPYIVSMWMYAIIARLRGRKVLFWTHGWLKNAQGPRDRLRNLFYRLAHALLLYGHRAEAIGQAIGFPPSSLHVVYNSLDYARQRAVRSGLECDDKEQPHELYFLCIARLTQKVRLDLAITALRILRERENLSVPLVLIGDGPARTELAALARSESVEVVFLGEMYDEAKIGETIFRARAVVSPGKVGLTAMHGLAYGVPVISHNDFGTQMPEFEAIEAGITGDFFQADSAEALAKVLNKWARKPRTEAERRSAIRVIEEKYNPERQVEAIERALFSVVATKA